MRSITAFPFRFTTFFLFMFTYAILGVLHKYLRVPGIVLDWHRRIIGRVAIRICFSIKEQYDSSEVIDTPIIVSNHVTWIDIIYYGTALKNRVSFVAKREVSSMPIVKEIAEFLQCIIERFKLNERCSTKEKI